MSRKTNENLSDDDNLCCVCFKNVEIYSLGSCDHAVCFECSTRMRILCKQNECPICRRDLPKVFFTTQIEPFSALFRRFEYSNHQDRKVGIIFCTPDVQKAYYKLLEHRCHVCEDDEHNRPFRTFLQLKDHMRREHELFYCDICNEHLKIFSFERKCYNRQELGYHRRKGDKNNSSHKGHPLCEFCDIRFMDNDELFRHLRRNHLFCHFCDADGKHQYYNSMEELKRHFKDEHFLCEEGECKTLALTAVFRSEIDLKGHIATHHSRFMSKSATRQARTLELEFTMAPRPRNDNMRNRRAPYERRDRYEDDLSYLVEPGGSDSGFSNAPQVFVNPLTSDHFPALGGNATNNNSNNISLISKNYTKFSNAAFKNNDFPSLGGGSSSSNRPTPAVTITTNSARSSAPEVTITRTLRPKSNPQKQKENFPALGGSSKQPGGSTVTLSVNSSNQKQSPKVSIQVNQKSNGAITTHITTSAPSTSQRTEFFPALGDASGPTNEPKWVQSKAKKQVEPKTLKVAPCPILQTDNLDSFPSLAKGKSEKAKKSSSVTVPVDSWVSLSSTKNNNKKLEQGASKGKSNGEERTDNNLKGGGESSKKGETNKKLSDLETKLANLKLVAADENKKTKKKKNKNPDEESNNKKEASKKDSGKDVNENEDRTNQNGMVKKRSELKIGSLSNTNSFVDDSPAVSSKMPPPGFSSKPNLPQSATVKPPPGFNSSSSNFPSLNFPNNDLTFTNSSGKSYAISPTKASTAYRTPSNFQNRNINLSKKFMEVLNDEKSMKHFMTLSGDFRSGAVDGKKYYQECRKIFANKFDDIFPELLVLLPVVEKQQELYEHLSGKLKENIIVCQNCQQVILKKELSEHYNHHTLENHFPSLGSAKEIDSAWKK
ncbi:unnamed protein product [Ceutorhynchus assimilis]|uniref:RING-type E3 ubiquitin transferase n=1 Tax=Ceutorhynchus assimilis TaxID=467358 RepID=A0A9N9QSG4_9CUCU|nr:unnamed protein product [Ceutorhynchus assimilis]